MGSGRFDLNRLFLSPLVSLNTKSCSMMPQKQSRANLCLKATWIKGVFNDMKHRITCVWPKGLQIGPERRCRQVCALLKNFCLCVRAFPISPTHFIPSYPGFSDAQTVADVLGFFLPALCCAGLPLRLLCGI